MSEKGCLYLVATPIGNLEDITLRALRTLKEVDLIAAEDTRQTLKLLNHFEIKKPLVSYHEHNKHEKGASLIRQLQEGTHIALVSDAGTPGISDPGEDLVKLAVIAGITVTMLPGPVAAVTGLVLSGLATGQFVFVGFLSTHKQTRKTVLTSLQKECRTMVFYEAPHKLLHTLKDLFAVLGDRKIALARELTKKFEEIVRCTLAEATIKYSVENPRGEFVIIVEGKDAKEMLLDQQAQFNTMSLSEHVALHMGTGLDKKEATKKVAEERGMSKREVYNALLKE